MNSPQMLKCEKCSKLMHANIYLGSLTSQGDLIMKQHKSFTCIQTENLVLIHDCGFTIRIESGIIKTELSPHING